MLLCLHCNTLFKYWDKVVFNGKKVCPRCGISKDLKQYSEETEWTKGMSEEIKRLKNKVKQGEVLTFSERYFLNTVEFLSDAFNDG